MAEALILKGGGGADTSVVTATAADVLENKVIVDQDGNPLTGTMTNRNVVDATIGGINSSYPSIAVHKGDNLQIGTTTVSNESLVALRVPDGYYNGQNYVGVPQADAATNLGLTAAKIATGNTILGVAGTYKGLGNATAAQVLSGKTFSTASLSNTTGTMNNYSGYTSTSNYVSSTFRSGATNYVFASPGGTGYYSTSSYLRIPATNLAAGNIKKGVTILGIKGTFEGYVSDVLTIYNNGTWSNMSTTGITALSDCTIESTNPITLKRSSSSSGTHWTRYARLNSAFDLTNYNYLKATAWADQTSYIVNAGIAVSTNVNCNSTAGLASTRNGSPSVITIDIRSLTGLYWIFLSVNADRKTYGCYFSNVKLSKT